MEEWLRYTGGSHFSSTCSQGYLLADEHPECCSEDGDRVGCFEQRVGCGGLQGEQDPLQVDSYQGVTIMVAKVLEFLFLERWCSLRLHDLPYVKQAAAMLNNTILCY